MTKERKRKRIVSPVRILAVDPGYERIGVAILEVGGGRERLLHSDCVVTPKTIPFEDRLLMVGNAIDELVSTYGTIILASETLFFATNKKTAMNVALSRGVIIYVAKKRGLTIFEYTPLQVKIAVTGYGRSDKAQVTEMTKKLISIDKTIRYDDEYDAIAIGLTCAATEKFKQK